MKATLFAVIWFDASNQKVCDQVLPRAPDLGLPFWFPSFYFLWRSWLWRLKSCQNSHTFKRPKLEKLLCFTLNPVSGFL